MKKTLIIVVVAVLVLAIVGGVVAFMLLGNNNDTKDTVYIYDVPGEAIVTNMQGSNGFVKASVSLGLTTDKKNPDLEAETAKIRDTVIFCLRGKTKEDYADPDIKNTLSDEICQELTEKTGLDIYKQVYFSDLVVQ